MLTLIPYRDPPAALPEAWSKRFLAALALSADHPDAARLDRLHDMLAGVRAEVRAVAAECEMHAVRVALTDGCDSVIGTLDDTLINMTCVLDAWDDERDARAHGNALDWQRAVRSA